MAFFLTQNVMSESVYNIFFVPAINFLAQMLIFDPSNRMTADDALHHLYMSDYAEPNDEPDCSHPFRIEDELDDYSYAKYQVHFSIVRFIF